MKNTFKIDFLMKGHGRPGAIPEYNQKSLQECEGDLADVWSDRSGHVWHDRILVLDLSNSITSNPPFIFFHIRSQ